MKTILIPTEDHDAMPAVLQTALLMARAFDSYMEGFAVRPSAGTYVTVEPVSSLAISGAYDGDAPKLARAMFEKFMHDNNVPAAVAGQDPPGLSYGWPMAESADDVFIGSYGRVFDLIVLGRPGRAPENARMAPLEAALFESGKPALIVPPEAPKVIGKNVLVAWNGSTEQAHTNAYALALVAPGRAGDRDHGRRQLHARSDRRGGRAPPAPERDQSAGVDGQAGNAQRRRLHPRKGRRPRLRSPGQERLYPEPVAADDLRRRHP